MTAVVEDTDTDVEGEATETEGGKRGRKSDRDFTKHNDLHQEIADYVNANSGLDDVTAFQVKAVQLLGADYRNTPENQATREAKKAARDLEKKEFEGLDDEDVKVIKASRRAAENAAKLQEKASAALERAKAVQQSSDASGEDLAAVVGSAQNGEEASTSKRRPGRRS